MQRLMVAALTSGAGKTSVTMGLAALWRQAGKTVQVYKTGPDYIDPQFHTAITGRPCINLDPYFMDASELRATSNSTGTSSARATSSAEALSPCPAIPSVSPIAASMSRISASL